MSARPLADYARLLSVPVALMPVALMPVALMTVALMTVLTVIAAACSSGNPGDATVRVLAASSLTGHLDSFDSGTTSPAAGFSFAGTPTVITQALAGAPADVLILADRPPQDLQSRFPNLTTAPLVQNILTLAVPAGNSALVTGLADLNRDELRIAVCAAEVPCGSIIDQLGVPIRADTREPNVRSVLTKIEQGEADVGLVYVTDVRTAEGRVEEIAIAPRAGTEYWAVNLRPGTAHVDAWFATLISDGDEHLVARGFTAVAGAGS